MFQIMFLYVLISFSCCHFARKYCAEDAEDSDSDSDEFEKVEHSEMMMVVEGMTVNEGGQPEEYFTEVNPYDQDQYDHDMEEGYQKIED